MKKTIKTVKTTIDTAIDNASKEFENALGTVFNAVDKAIDASGEAINAATDTFSRVFDGEDEVSRIVTDEVTISLRDGHVIITGAPKSVKLNGKEIK
jgi:hypothetical protein